ncbi:hypothetical protein D3C76_1299980 [compost metagenome]
MRLDHARLQHGSGDRVGKPQVFLEVGLVSSADIQFPAQPGEVLNGELALDRRQCIELPGGRGFGDERRGRFVSLRFGFRILKVVQGGVEQRDRPGARGTGLDREPWNGLRNVQAQEGRLDVQFQAVPGFQCVTQKRFGKVPGVLQFIQHGFQVVTLGQIVRAGRFQ